MVKHLIPLLVALSLTANAAITVTPKGTNSAGSTGASINLVSVACSTGDLLVVTLGVGQTGATVTWNSISMSLASSVNYTGATTAYIFYLVVASGATGTVTASWTGNHAVVLSASTISGLASAVVDVTHTGTGSGTAPSSGATATTTAAVEIAFGVTVMTGVAAAGTWQNSWSANQSVTATGSALCLLDGFLVLSSTGAQTAALTGTNSGAWGAVIATFKSNAENMPPVVY